MDSVWDILDLEIWYNIESYEGKLTITKRTFYESMEPTDENIKHLFFKCFEIFKRCDNDLSHYSELEKICHRLHMTEDNFKIEIEKLYNKYEENYPELFI